MSVFRSCHNISVGRSQDIGSSVMVGRVQILQAYMTSLVQETMYALDKIHLHWKRKIDQVHIPSAQQVSLSSSSVVP
jgi:hypothetical protein